MTNKKKTLLQKLNPSNYLEEKEKFFADYHYNPQFTYEHPITSKQLLQHGLPQQKYLDLAQIIVNDAYHHRTETELYATEGPVVSHREVEQKCKVFLTLHNLEHRYRIVWSNSFISRASATSQLIKLKSSAEFRREGLLGLMYHEVGTHVLRRVNYEQQPWFKQKKQFGFGNYLRTEEGLAVIHALIPHTYKSAFRSAVRYLAVNYARQHSFTELWQFLEKYIDDPETRWMVTFRQKRGLPDTSQPGGFTKDLVYFEGMVEVLDWLNKHAFNLTSLYYGKIGLADAPKAVQLNPHFEPILPIFYTNHLETYATEIMEIAKMNHLNS